MSPPPAVPFERRMYRVFVRAERPDGLPERRHHFADETRLIVTTGFQDAARTLYVVAATLMQGAQNERLDAGNAAMRRDVRVRVEYGARRPDDEPARLAAWLARRYGPGVHVVVQPTQSPDDEWEWSLAASAGTLARLAEETRQAHARGETTPIEVDIAVG